MTKMDSRLRSGITLMGKKALLNLSYYVRQYLRFHHGHEEVQRSGSIEDYRGAMLFGVTPLRTHCSAISSLLSMMEVDPALSSIWALIWMFLLRRALCNTNLE
jgi:hypothetical protein